MNPQCIITYEHQTQNPSRSRTYTVNFFGTQITTLVTSTPAVARQWVYNLRSNYSDDLYNSALVVGLGVQWRATSSPTAATLQLCVGEECLIFQLSHANSVPLTLRRLLEDDRVSFVGVHNGRDQMMLKESWAELDVECLVDLARKEGFGNTSMGDMAADVLGLHGIFKPRELGLSDWDQYWLSGDQVQYACVDAHVSYLLAMELWDDDEEEEEEEVDYCDDEDDGDYYSDDESLDYEDYSNPLHYDSNWNYIG